MTRAITDHSLPPLEPINDPDLVRRAKEFVDALKRRNEARRIAAELEANERAIDRWIGEP